MRTGAYSISIIIPAFNASTLEEALRSCLRQKKAIAEVVVIDDGSVPPERERVSSDLRSHGRIHWYYQPHSGPSVARNYGAHRSHGSYLAFLDADDLLVDGWCESLMEVIQSKSDVSLASCGVRVTTVTDKGINERDVLPKQAGAIHNHAVGCFLPGAYVVAADVFRAIGGFDPKCVYGEHHELAIRILDFARRNGLNTAWTARIGVERRLVRTSTVVAGYARARAIGAEYTVRKHPNLFARDPVAKSARLGVAGVAYAQMGDYQNARRLLLESLRIKPGVRAIARAISIMVRPIAKMIWLSNHRDGAREEQL